MYRYDLAQLLRSQSKHLEALADAVDSMEKMENTLAFEMYLSSSLTAIIQHLESLGAD